MSNFPQIPGYEIQGELGRGGMAVVYSAIETDLGRQVAIKVVRGEEGDADGHIQRLENEARGLAALHHPHIVDLYRFGRTGGGGLYYVMPLLPGGSLEDWPKPVAEERVVALLDNLLDALAHAHAEDIVHRDIKPSNILFDRHGRPLLADFGAAFMRQRESRITDHGTVIGSSGYMSPEQARGLPVDARSDLYSTAVLAFELLTGKRPWEGPDGLSTALAQLEQPVPRLPESLRHWQGFFDKALAVAPQQRFANAAEMRAAIHGLRGGSPGAAKRGAAMAMAIALALALVLVGAYWKLRDHDVAKPAATVATVLAATQPAGQPAKASTPAVVAVPEVAVEARKPVAVGDRFRDPRGPELVLARSAKGSHPGLAVMAAPIDATTYRRYATQRHRVPVGCAKPAPPAQACLGLPVAIDLARWLSAETGKRYRVPTRAELEGSIGHVVRAPVQAWTSTCNEVRVARPRNAAQRGWARIRKAVGKPKPLQYDLRCDGNFTIELDGRGKSATAREAASPKTVVVLVR